METVTVRKSVPVPSLSHINIKYLCFSDTFVTVSHDCNGVLLHVVSILFCCIDDVFAAAPGRGAMCVLLQQCCLCCYARERRHVCQSCFVAVMLSLQLRQAEAPCVSVLFCCSDVVFAAAPGRGAMCVGTVLLQ